MRTITYIYDETKPTNKDCLTDCMTPIRQMMVNGKWKVNDMRLNLNDNIRVKLTEHGKDIYYHQYDRTNKLLGREVCKPSYPKVDEDGYTTFQLWCFMELYGVHMGMTLPNVIEPLDIVFDAPTIEERKPGKWNFIGNQMFECTKCGVCYTQNQLHQMMVRITDPEFPKFCPNCGAKMEEGE